MAPAGLKELFTNLADTVRLEAVAEREAVIRKLMFMILGTTTADIMANRMFDLAPEQHSKLMIAVDRINKHEPLQYILGKTEFFGRTFSVNPHVLIPRPETEELVEVVLQSLPAPTPLSIVDIGTGSGCIAATLALERTHWSVSATDVSHEALQVARANAGKLNARVAFCLHDILHEPWSLERVDAVISNPPYIPEPERKQLSRQVADYEPNLALFVTGDDPLLFYKAILNCLTSHLSNEGMVFFEVHEHFGRQVKALAQSYGFRTELIVDLSGKERIVKGKKELR